jgi:hypothetical protein
MADDYQQKQGRSTDTFTRIAVSVIGAVIAGGVIGIWSMGQSVARLEERVASWTVIFERRMESFDKELREQDHRVDGLESTISRNSARLEGIERGSRRNLPPPK